jgi:NAD(P)H-dependent flavin oxidoreductase YrpB (nitropropane dioxygenase family)
MGVGVSSWPLARRVAMLGEIGVVSGTCIDTVMVRELQEGDPGNRRGALEAYPDQEIVRNIMDRHFIEGGKAEDEPYRLLPIHRFRPTVRSQRILAAAAFSEVYLAKAGHDGIVGINLMAKLKRYTLACLYGAMLAGVDRVFIGAGIPLEEAKQIPKLAAGEAARLRLEVDTDAVDEDPDKFYYSFDPADVLPDPPVLSRPEFYPIISSDLLARILAKKLPGELIDGWVIEGPPAGGHNAPPRNKSYDENRNPVYDDKDIADLQRLEALGFPYYLAGGYGTPEQLREALELGAAGIQVGSLFSLCQESGYPPEDTRRLIRAIHEDRLEVNTDGRISPTGFPFKVLEMEGKPSAREKAARRSRICDLGYLRKPYLDEKGRLHGRCAAAPVETYVNKGGKREEAEGRACLCNALFANIGLPQLRRKELEHQIFTGGDQLLELPLGSAEDPHYTAEEVLRYLYGELPVDTGDNIPRLFSR